MFKPSTDSFTKCCSSTANTAKEVLVKFVKHCHKLIPKDYIISCCLKFLCLSWLSASFIKSTQVAQWATIAHLTPIMPRRSDIGFFNNQGQVTPKKIVQLIWDFMAVLDICKFHKDLIETKWAMASTRSNTQGQVTLSLIVQSGHMFKV